MLAGAFQRTLKVRRENRLPGDVLVIE